MNGRSEGQAYRFTSPEQVGNSLAETGYLASDRSCATVYLGDRLGKPVLIEGPAGTGKTELAKSVAAMSGMRLIRLQCYEGLDEAKALYEWNYRKQLLRIQAESGDTGWSEVQEDIFGEEFLLPRPLMTAIASEQPVVLLIDEIDKTDQEFEAMLLELLSDFQISIPELGRIDARTQPVVLLTSNSTRDLGDALKRRCLHLHIGFPDDKLEAKIIASRVPGIDARLLKQLVSFVQQLRALDLKKVPSVSETIDWAKIMLLLHTSVLEVDLVRDTLNVLLKFEADIEVAGKQLAGLTHKARHDAGVG